MTFEIEVGGRSRSVTVERAGDGPHRYRVSVDGVVSIIDAARPTPDTWSLIVAETGRSHEVMVARGVGSGELLLSTAGHTVAVTVNGRRVRRGSDAGGGRNGQRLLAPMPGKVLRVLVQIGDEVAARQPLVVVEAMKMENELVSTTAGRVTQVAVSEQALVEAGQLLVVVEV